MATCSKSSSPNLDQSLAFKVHIPHQENKDYSFVFYIRTIQYSCEKSTSFIQESFVTVFIMSSNEDCHVNLSKLVSKMYSYQKCFTAVSMVSTNEDRHINVDNVPLLQRPESTLFVHIVKILRLNILERLANRYFRRSPQVWDAMTHHIVHRGADRLWKSPATFTNYSWNIKDMTHQKILREWLSILIV